VTPAPDFSALQRAEIAEICTNHRPSSPSKRISVLFNEPKLLKFFVDYLPPLGIDDFSALQRAEIAEIVGENARKEAAK